jgi:hypothetical protein
MIRSKLGSIAWFGKGTEDTKTDLKSADFTDYADLDLGLGEPIETEIDTQPNHVFSLSRGVEPKEKSA